MASLNDPNTPDLNRSHHLFREENENLIGEGGMNDNLINNRFFNVHNGINLAGYGYFPPLIYQALTTQVNVEKNPLDGTQLPYDANRQTMRSLMYAVFVLIIFMVIFF